jgi:hypothetical protein
MNVQDINCFLRRKYELSPRDSILLERIQNCKILSFSYTTFGGFDITTGQFYPDTREVNYKIRIKYKKGNNAREEYMYLIPRVWVLLFAGFFFF